MKNELIIASHKGLARRRPSERLQEMLRTFGLEELEARFFSGEPGQRARAED